MKNDYSEFSMRLREERMRCGMTQQQLCGYTEMQQNVFSRVETGRLRLAYPGLKRLCTSGVDVFYVFTGNRPTEWLDFLEPSVATSKELLHLLGIVYIHARAMKTRCRVLSGDSARACNRDYREACFGRVREQMSCLQLLTAESRTNRNIFRLLRNHHGYTQKKMASLLGMDIKTLRNLEKGRRLPDSEIIWTMYHQFHVPPALILMDPQGLRSELNHALSLLAEEDRNVMLQILEISHGMISS